jgi:hypothetical protein
VGSAVSCLTAVIVSCGTAVAVSCGTAVESAVSCEQLWSVRTAAELRLWNGS